MSRKRLDTSYVSVVIIYFLLHKRTTRQKYKLVRALHFFFFLFDGFCLFGQSSLMDWLGNMRKSGCLFASPKGLYWRRFFSTEYDYTGGTGRESTGLSASEQEAREKVIRLYRYALSSVKDIRKHYRLNESKEDIAACIRDLFERHRHVQDRKLIDMLVFKGRQDIDEVRAQWKGRHQVLNYLRAFEEKKIKERAQLVMEQHVRDDDEFRHVPNAILAANISHWKKNKLIPEDISTPKQVCNIIY